MGITASIDLSDFREARRKFDVGLAITLHNGVAMAAKVGRDHAKKVGKFKDQTGKLRKEIRSLPPRRVGSFVESIIESPTYYARFVEEGTKKHDIYPMDYGGKGGPRHSTKGEKPGKNAGKRAAKTRPGSVTAGAGRGQYLRFRIGGRIIFAKMVKHPGSRAFPFMGPAYIAAESFIWAYFEREVPELGAHFNG